MMQGRLQRLSLFERKITDMTCVMSGEKGERYNGKMKGVILRIMIQNEKTKEGIKFA